jgi:uncharacterized Fe-S cluster protein YjdI
MTEKTYSNDDITVAWKPDLCIHSEKCFKGLGAVFDPNRRPWVDMSRAETTAIKAQVDQCPSGALSWTAKAGVAAGASTAAAPAIIVEPTPNGPLLVKSAHQLNLADGTTKQRSGTTAYCRCGASNRKPFCDGSHARVGFKG